MGKKEYLTFIGKLETLTQGQEIELLIKDLTSSREKYDARYVKAIVSSDPENLPDGDVLWIKGWVGVAYPNPWAIKIIDELGEFLTGTGG